MIRSSKSIDSNEINPNSNNKGRNNKATKKTIIKLKDKYISNDKIIKILAHYKINMLRREKTDDTDSYNFITQKEQTISNNILVDTGTVEKLKPVVQKQTNKLHRP